MLQYKSWKQFQKLNQSHDSSICNTFNLVSKLQENIPLLFKLPSREALLLPLRFAIRIWRTGYKTHLFTLKKYRQHLLSRLQPSLLLLLGKKSDLSAAKVSRNQPRGQTGPTDARRRYRHQCRSHRSAQTGNREEISLRCRRMIRHCKNNCDNSLRLQLADARGDELALRQQPH